MLLGIAILGSRVFNLIELITIVALFRARFGFYSITAISYFRLLISKF